MNAFKHAFPDGRAGTIRIALRESGSEVELVCRDDGVGAGNIAASKRGLGLQLIEAYAGQIGGVATFRNENPGVGLSVIFPRA
jgi:two-component sensor histidine kinase